MGRNGRIRVTLGALGLLVFARVGAPAVATQPDYVFHRHTFGSGFVTVNPSTERIRLSVVNGDKTWSHPFMALYTLSGGEWLAGTHGVDPGQTAQVEATPRGTIQLRAVIRISDTDGLDANLYPASFEIVEKRPDGWHTVTHVPLTESDTTAASP